MWYFLPQNRLLHSEKKHFFYFHYTSASGRQTITELADVLSTDVLERRFTKFGEITQSKDNYAIQGHSRSPLLVPIRKEPVG